MATKRKNKLAQKILYFYCPPCREYHLKTHAHYRAMRKRAALRKVSHKSTANAKTKGS